MAAFPGAKQMVSSYLVGQIGAEKREIEEGVVMVGRIRGRAWWAGVVLVVTVVAGCSAGQGSGRTVTMDSGDRFDVTLPQGWTIEPSDSEEVFLFGKSEGAIFVSEADCAPAAQCSTDRLDVFGGKMTEVMFNGLAYQRHDYEAAWAGGGRQSYYVDWNSRTYTFTISVPNDQEIVETVMGSVVWQE